MSACEKLCKNWGLFREKYLQRLKRDIDAGMVDTDIADILVALNSIPCIVTTSSCSGRIVVIAAKTPHDKRSSSFVFKSHKKITMDDLERVIEGLVKDGFREEFVWISVQPVILHMYVCGYLNAVSVMRIFESIGFKYACMKPTRHENVFYVHISGTERLDIPLFLIKSKTSDVERTVILLNTYLSFTKSKVERLRKAVASLRGIMRLEDAENESKSSYKEGPFK